MNSDNSPQEQTCVIVGAGHAGSQLAIQLRKEGWSGHIVLLGAEKQLPYHRPPLSKAVLAGEKTLEQIFLRPENLYTANQIELRLGEQVKAILPTDKLLQLNNGELLPYDKLALCPGARVIRLPLGENLQGVHYLRTIEDIMAIREQLAPGLKAVIIGGGYIGLETAAVLARLGLSVSILERAQRILQRVSSEPVAKYFTALHEREGVRIVTGAEVTAINGQGGVESVLCADGSIFPADLVVIGVGVVPETALAAAAGLSIENGIVVDAFARTSCADIYAAGDCTSHPSALYGRSVRLESVQNANDQARVAAASICGRLQSYDALPWFWSDQYDCKLQSVGLSTAHDSLIIRGDCTSPDSSGFTVLYGQGGRLIASDSINRPKEFMACKRLVQAGVAWSHALGDESIALEGI